MLFCIYLFNKQIYVKMASCNLTDVEMNDPRFPSLREYYEKHWSDVYKKPLPDDFLCLALQMYREAIPNTPVDWYPETPQQKGAFTRFIKYRMFRKKPKKMASALPKSALYDLYAKIHYVFTPRQLDARLSMLEHDFRKLVDRLEDEDDTGRSRQEIIAGLASGGMNGYEVIMSQLFQKYATEKPIDAEEWFERITYFTDESRRRKHAKHLAIQWGRVLMYKEALAALAAPRIGEAEGFVVNYRNLEANLAAEEANPVQTDTEQKENEDSKDDAAEVSKGDRYGDFRLTKMMDKVSSQAKRILGDLLMVDAIGNPIYDDIDNKQYVSPRMASVVLYRTLVNATPETMMDYLRSATYEHPWMRSLIARLENRPDDKTVIYTNFKSAKTTYVTTYIHDGMYKARSAHEKTEGHPLVHAAVENLRGGLFSGETSIINKNGWLKSPEEIRKIRDEVVDLPGLYTKLEVMTTSIKLVEGDKPYSEKYMRARIERAKEEYGQDISYILLDSNRAMREFVKANQDVLKTLSKALCGVGFSVSAYELAKVACTPLTEQTYKALHGKLNHRNRLLLLVDYVGAIYATAAAYDLATGNEVYNVSPANFNAIGTLLAPGRYDEVENRVVDGNKALSVYNNTNLMHQVVDILSFPDTIVNIDEYERLEEEYLTRLEEEFLGFEGMSLGFGKQRQACGWLRMLFHDEYEIRRKFKVVNSAAFNNIDYEKMTKAQKMTSALIMYLKGGEKVAAAGLYECPIQSDYTTAYDFVAAPRLSKEEIVKELTYEVLIELERIASIQEREEDPDRIKLVVYESRGRKLQIFPELNDTSFVSDYAGIEDADEAMRFVRDAVEKQLEKVVEKDIAAFEKARVLTDPLLKNVVVYRTHYSFYSVDGSVAGLGDEEREKLEWYFLNTFYAREQMCKLFTGGLEQFSGTIDYEKRNMLCHATHSSLYTEATWNGKKELTIDGKTFKNSSPTQNVIYVKDFACASAFLDDIKEILKGLLSDGIITDKQYDDMVKTYSNINVTDGQGFRTLESHRMIMIESGQWDDAHEKAFIHIVQGRPSKADLRLFMRNIKPVFCGYEVIPAAKGQYQKPIRATVLHKYSEQVLLPVALAKYCLQAKSVPLQALDRAQARLKRQGKDIDMFLFHSGVKVGAHSVLQPFALDKGGNKILTSAEDMADYIVEQTSSNEGVVHTLQMKYYGIAAATPVHKDDKIAWASQAEKVAWGNIEEGQKLVIHGQTMAAAEAREIYNDIKTADIVQSYAELRDTFRDSGDLERMLQEELTGKPYATEDVKYALAHLRDGKFALPLFSPNVSHQVEQLLASVMKKRLVKPTVKGANILQTTGFGLDLDASTYDADGAISEKDKLRIVFDGKGESKRVKYVEAFLNIDSFDSRLRGFADADGNIGPARLRELVDKDIIPESMLEFIAYRTPSDAEHSVIPCKIKGFTANLGGANIMVPKEVMKMTGHDYDGDKLRCQFKSFRLVDKSGVEAKLNAKALLRMVFGMDNVNEKMRHCELYEYNYDMSALENSKQARANARVELMFAQLTSPSGSRRMMMPGDFAASKMVAKSMYLVRASKDYNVAGKIAEAFVSLGMDKAEATRVVRTPALLYKRLTEQSDMQLAEIMRTVDGAESPFSVKHAADAFEYLMGGAGMIAIYAKYNAAMQLFQRLNLSYSPRLTKDGKPYTVTIFGKTFDRLFGVRNREGGLASGGLSRLLQASVDNGKDPILGYLNQTPQLADMTFLLLGAGLTEEDVHVLMNQPSVRELGKRLSGKVVDNMGRTVETLIEELAGSSRKSGDITQWVSVKEMAKLSRERLTGYLAYDYSELVKDKDAEETTDQIYILRTLQHLSTAADTLSSFTTMMRPDSATGAIGASAASIIAKIINLNKFRRKVDESSDNDIRISGIREVIQQRDVHEGWDTEYIEELLEGRVPEIVALNSLLIDNSPDLLRKYFPQMREDWINVIAEIADYYDDHKVNERTVETIARDLILYKLLGDKKFVNGDVSEEQRRIIVDVPKQVRDLFARINKAKQGNSDDAAARVLITNAFLNKLTVTEPTASKVPRLKFIRNGAAIEGQRDLISAAWGEMLYNPDQGVRDLAIDLFRYNLYTSGFKFGMYEFFQYAPFSIIMKTPGYVDALRGMLKQGWSDWDRNNVIHQYFQNHWGDTRCVSKYYFSKLSLARPVSDTPGQVWVSKNDAALDAMNKKLYVVLVSRKKSEDYDRKYDIVETLYEITPGNSEAGVILVEAPKLGSVNKHRQVTVQYNPSMIYSLMTPVVPGNESAWDWLNSLDTRGQNDTPSQRNSFMDIVKGVATSGPGNMRVNMFMQNLVKQYVEKDIEQVEETAPKAVEQNLEKENKDVPNSYDGIVTPEPNTVFVFGSNNNGRHDAGAAKIAVEQFDAEYGKGEGLQGNAYAIPTFWKKENGGIRIVSDRMIDFSIRKMYIIAQRNPSKQFKVADKNDLIEKPWYGYTDAQMIRMFQKAGNIPSNVLFSKNWTDQWNEVVDDVEKKAGVFSAPEKMLHIVRVDEETGEVSTKTESATPENVALARKQEIFVRLNQRLREMLRKKGISVGVLTSAEARLHIGGIAVFDTAPVLANGLVEMIRLAEGQAGEYALPEEFAHVALEMLGHDHPLVQRLLTALGSNQEALQEAFEGQYVDYRKAYSEDNRDKLILEAAGKLVAKHLLRQQEIKSSHVRSLIHRIVDAIRNLFRKFDRRRLQDDILDANDIASALARDLLGGRILDDMTFDNIGTSEEFYSIRNEAERQKKDISEKDDINHKLLKTELKRLDILKRRYPYLKDGETNPEIEATKQQIQKLEYSIKNFTAENAVMSYLTDALDFLANAEKTLDDSLYAGRAANVVCRNLNTVRDTLYSYLQSVEDIRAAVRDGEITGSDDLIRLIDSVSGVVARFYDKYQVQAGRYFEHMLANVYGEHGITVTTGRDKGRVITIHEMARKADHDISLATRMFHSLADCSDFVLKAVDDITRNAKISARRRTESVRPMIEDAVNKLVQETGSADQTFMFEYKKGEDGKMHKTGKYITEEAAKALGGARYEFYRTVMKIKKEVDEYLPETLLEDGKIIMMRKYDWDRVKDKEGLRGKGLAVWENLKNRVMDTSDNVDYENYDVVVDFEGNKVDMLPVKFLQKSKKETYDDMTDDVATSLMTYVGMANEYGELNNVISVLENAKYMASQRDVAQKAGSKRQRENIVSDEYTFNRPFTRKQAGTQLQAALDDFFQMHLYGHIRANEGNIGNTRINKRKVVDTVNSITSLSQMALNLPQRIANVSTGMTQILIESVGKEEFSMKDVLWAAKVWMQQSGDRLAETGKTDYDNKLSLWLEFFDIHQNNGRERKNYAKGRMSRIFNSSLLYAGLTLGEDYLASVTALALARNYRVKSPYGKITNMWEAYEVDYTDPKTKSGAYLKLSPGYTHIDGSQITFEDERDFSKKAAGLNFELQGIYNLDDKSSIQQYAFGALIIMYRKWIAPSLKRRYASAQYNALRGTYEEGYHKTMFRVIGDILRDAKKQVTEEQSAKALFNIVTDMKALRTSFILNRGKLTEYEKSNITRSMTELAVVVGLWLACSLFGKIEPPEYEDDERGKMLKWWDNTVYAQMLRLKTEIGSQAPTPMLVDEAMHILSSPFAAIRPLQNAINSFQLCLPSNYVTKIESGKYKGHSKAYKYFRELPIISMFKKVDNFVDPSPMISYYKSDAVF